MTRREFLSKLRAARRRWDEQWKGIVITTTSEPPAPGKMSLRDLLNHVAWYEREMVETLRSHRLAGSSWWELPTDERNIHIQSEGQDISFRDAFCIEQVTYADLVKELKKLKDAEFDDASYFHDMPPDWKPWEMIASNSTDHYLEHIQDIIQNPDSI